MRLLLINKITLYFLTEKRVKSSRKFYRFTQMLLANFSISKNKKCALVLVLILICKRSLVNFLGFILWIATKSTWDFHFRRQVQEGAF